MVRTRKRTSRSRVTAPTTDYRDIEKKIVPVGDLKPVITCVLYGKPGTGKTTLASTFPKPLVLIDCSEKGTDSIRTTKNIDVLRAESWEDLEKIYWYLKKGKGRKYKTVVVDTMSQAQDLCIKSVKEPTEEGSLGNWGDMTKSDWGKVSTKLKTWAITVRNLKMCVVYVAHERLRGGEEEDDEQVIAPSVGARLMPSVASVVEASVSIIGNTFIRERFIKPRTKRRKGQSRKPAKRVVEYCLRIGPNATFTTKMRKPKDIVLPDELVDPCYKDIINLVKGD